MTDKKLCERFRALLDRLVECSRYPSEYYEEAHAAALSEIATFPREARVLAALDRAIDRSKRRREEAASLLYGLTDIPRAAEQVRDLLEKGDAQARCTLIQAIGSGNLMGLAPLLNDIMLRDPSEDCRQLAIRAAGDLRTDVNFPTLLAVAAKPGSLSKYSRIPDSILWALKDYARPECRPHLQRAFDRPTRLQDPTIAAWGLCKLGPHPKAHRYLVGLLADKHRDRETHYYTDIGLRAAQALADVHGWRFEWGQKGVRQVLKRLKSRTA